MPLLFLDFCSFSFLLVPHSRCIRFFNFSVRRYCCFLFLSAQKRRRARAVCSYYRTTLVDIVYEITQTHEIAREREQTNSKRFMNAQLRPFGLIWSIRIGCSSPTHIQVEMMICNCFRLSCCALICMQGMWLHQHPTSTWRTHANTWRCTQCKHTHNTQLQQQLQQNRKVRIVTRATYQLRMQSVGWSHTSHYGQ